MTPALLESIMAHVTAEAPREACGVLTWDGKDGAVYHPCRNVASGDDEFEIHPEDWVAAEDAGPILGVVHSHPGGTTKPSEADIRNCVRSAVPWWIFDLDGNWNRFKPPEWPLEGHPFAWGVQDCFTLARDAFMGVPDFPRSPKFWETRDLFMENLAEAGFETVTDGPAVGDGILMSIRGGGLANHCAVYLGAGRIAHHLPGRLSREESLGPLNRAVVAVVRRKR